MIDEFDESDEPIAMLRQSAQALGPVAAPDGFSDRVLARVALEPRAAAASWTRLLPAAMGSDPLPWWVRSLAQPVSALAFLLLGVTLAFRAAIGQAPAAVANVSAMALQAAAPFVSSILAPFARATEVPGGTLAFALAAIPLAVLATWACYEASRTFARTHTPAFVALTRRPGP